MAVYQIDPLSDPRWPELLRRHPKASVFHTPGWLLALKRTYGYEPVVYTTSGPRQELRNGIPFCHIQSWLTGRRLVSLPFTDHCQPLVDRPGELEELYSALEEDGRKSRWKYIELRPLETSKEVLDQRTAFRASEQFAFHALDLRPDLPDLVRGLHASCVRRPIRRAEREGLTYEQGASDALLTKFYRLLVMTRRRHLLPPQPILWFRNLISCLGEWLAIRVASKDGQPIAAVITLAYKDCVIYKYGCSDPQYYNMGGMIALLWQAIQEAKQRGAADFDLGRSAGHQAGLVSFKDHWGALRSTITYYRYPIMRTRDGDGWHRSVIKHVFAHAPEQALMTAGKLLYRHMG